MPFDQPQRNRLARFVADARALLVEENTRQLQAVYGMDPASGAVADLGDLEYLDDSRRETARILRATLAHYLAATPKPAAKERMAALDRIVREQAFTVLNRLCALRLAEARGILLESIAQGYRSKGFQLYATLAGGALGETGDAYRVFLFSLFDEFAVDLPVLFDRFSPLGRLFPGESALLRLLDLINHPDLDFAWGEDETIGWIYQYFNSKEERQKMRAESQAPRNSRELAVRNQFFTPRYVVEFLTDNTLGRIWYEMTRGETRLVDQCRYLVRRPTEIFLDAQYVNESHSEWVHKAARGDFSALPDDPEIDDLSAFSLLWIAYDHTERLGYGDYMQWAEPVNKRFVETGSLPSATLELYFLLFGYQRAHAHGNDRSDGFDDLWRTIFRAFKASLNREGLSQEELLREPVFVGHRPPKDPRTILMLDPACGSMHFGLYAFDLYQTIYEEAWEKGWIPAEDFGYRPNALLLHETVRYNQQRTAISNYSGREIPPEEERYLVISRRGDIGDGVHPNRPYIVDALTRFRVPFDVRIPLSEFDYQRAIADGLFDAATGENLVRECGCFIYEELPAVSREEAHARFVRELPRLIIEHNIHGIDIDPRAVQIAGLSLWLRAQRAWQEQGLPVTQRPTITRSNVVCAEPMPGERGLLRDFAAILQPRVLGQLMERVFDKMKLAGEAGSLLKIEEEIQTDLETARTQWEQSIEAARDRKGRTMLFSQRTLDEIEGKTQQRLFDVEDIPGGDFWEVAEARLLEALRAYAAQAQGDEATRRRLFSDDVEQGFAFIDLCRKRYDVVLMNPPFGKSPVDSAAMLASAFPDEWKDLYACFIARALSHTTETGCVGAITSLVFLYSKHLRPLRQRIISGQLLSIAVELGGQVLDSATVETALTVLSPRVSTHARFLDLEGVAERSTALANAVRQGSFDIRSLHEFTNIHGWPLAYHVHPAKLALWSRPGRFEPRIGKVVAGNHTFDDFRFLRLAIEVAPDCIHAQWYFYEKGGEFHPFVSPQHLVFNWVAGGREARAYQVQEYGTDAQTIQSISSWFRRGITYPRISSVGFGPRVLPAHCIFSEKGMSVFLNDDSDLLPVLGLLVSTWTEDLLQAFGRTRAYENSAVANLPYGQGILNRARLPITPIVENAVNASLRLEQSIETSQYFIDHSDSPARPNMSSSLADHVGKACDAIDEIVAGAIFRAGCESVPLTVMPKSVRVRQYVPREPSLTRRAEDRVSFAVGTALGRWDVRFATGERQPPPLPDPFAPLPVCPPGMLQNEQGLPAAPHDVPASYPLRISWGGILVDDPGHPEDVEARLRDVLQVIWGERAGAIEDEACQILGVDSLRAYMRKPAAFFDDHLKRYSKSRRAAPIYWPLSTPSGSYTVWLYYHRLSDQTLYQCVNDFVEPKLKQVAAEVDRLRRLPRRSRAEEAEYERLGNFGAELSAFRAELLRLAPIWKPNLNDGVQITAAPLYRLFQHRAWQKRLKETWEKLEAGDYDWAHLAYSLWPERVKQKCVTDKSLAIAHDLEDLYDESLAPKKKSRKSAPVEDDELNEE